MLRFSYRDFRGSFLVKGGREGLPGIRDFFSPTNMIYFLATLASVSTIFLIKAVLGRYPEDIPVFMQWFLSLCIFAFFLMVGIPLIAFFVEYPYEAFYGGLGIVVPVMSFVGYKLARLEIKAYRESPTYELNQNVKEIHNSASLPTRRSVYDIIND